MGLFCSFRSFIFALLAAAAFNLLSTERVMAQETTDGRSELSFFVGNLLPNQIHGVTEILPVFGARYGFHTESLGVAEFGFANTHAEGVDFTTVSVSLRADMPEVDAFTGHILGGVDLNVYRPIHSDSRKSETGLHVGTGLRFRVTNSFSLRADLKFMASPGTSLSVLIGGVFFL